MQFEFLIFTDPREVVAWQSAGACLGSFLVELERRAKGAEVHRPLAREDCAEKTQRRLGTGVAGGTFGVAATLSHLPRHDTVSGTSGSTSEASGAPWT